MGVLRIKSKKRHKLKIKKSNNRLLISKSLKRLDDMFVIKEDRIIFTNDRVPLDKIFNGSHVMIQYEPNKYMSIPYRIYKKLLTIKQFDMKYSIIIDEENDMFDNTVTYDLSGDRCKLYTMTTCITDVMELVRHIAQYEAFWKSMDIYSLKMKDLVYVGREKIEVTYLTGRIEPMTYSQFFKKYFDFLGL